MTRAYPQSQIFSFSNTRICCFNLNIVELWLITKMAFLLDFLSITIWFHLDFWYFLISFHWLKNYLCLFRLSISSSYSTFPDDVFLTFTLSFSSCKKVSFNLCKICLFVASNLAIFCSLRKNLLLIFLGIMEFNIWSDLPSFCTYNLCSSFILDSFCFQYIYSLLSYYFFLYFFPKTTKVLIC